MSRTVNDIRRDRYRLAQEIMERWDHDPSDKVEDLLVRKQLLDIESRELADREEAGPDGVTWPPSAAQRVRELVAEVARLEKIIDEKIDSVGELVITEEYVRRFVEAFPDIIEKAIKRGRQFPGQSAVRIAQGVVSHAPYINELKARLDDDH